VASQRAIAEVELMTRFKTPREFDVEPISRAATAAQIFEPVMGID
jgi:hypothetical protein